MQRTLRYLLGLTCGAVPALLLFLCLLGWRMRRLRRLGLQSSVWRETALAVLWMYCGGMIVLTIMPSWVVSSLVDVFHGYRWNAGNYPFFSVGTMNLRLFQTFAADGWSLYNIAGNLIMFLPFGFFAALLWRNFTWGRAFLVGLCITAGVECCQLAVGRAFDVDDLLLNTAGALLGYGLWLLLRPLPVLRYFHCRTAGEDNA